MTSCRNGADAGLFQAVVRNSVWSTFAVVASPILQFVFGGLTLRYVGVDATGFSLAVGAVLGIAGRFGTCGIGEASLPAIASALASGDDTRTRRLIGLVLLIYTASSVITAGAVYACADPFMEWSRAPVADAMARFFIACACLSFVLSQLNLALATFLRAAGRYDLVTAVTAPLTLASGIVACVVVPLFPSLTTVALVGLTSAIVTTLITAAVVSRAVPAVHRPLLGVAELPSLARYGFWLSLTHAFSALTGGVDDLVITGVCGANAVPPWAIGKRLWLTAHTFLAQHTEHLIPTLGSLRHSARDVAAGVAMAMHWYVMLLAATGYTFMASSGEVIVGMVAGADVGALCRPAILSYSVAGIVFALLIIPVIGAMAEGASRPAFVGADRRRLLASEVVWRSCGLLCTRGCIASPSTGNRHDGDKDLRSTCSVAMDSACPRAEHHGPCRYRRTYGNPRWRALGLAAFGRRCIACHGCFGSDDRCRTTSFD